MKAILMSIQPKWVEKILSGAKTIEIRKTAPKPPFKAYVYCTKGEPLCYFYSLGTYKTTFHGSHYANGQSCNVGQDGNGRVVAEFICNKVSNLEEAIESAMNDNYHSYNDIGLDKACLHIDDLNNYMQKGKYGVYGLHISDLKIYDTPKELGEFKRPCIMPEMPYCPSCRYGCTTFPEDTTKQDLIDGCECEWGCLNTVTRPPQNYVFVEEL